MTNSERLAAYREVLTRLAAQRAARAKKSEPDATALADAFAEALSRFTTADGSLKVSQQNGATPYGGG